MQVYSSPGCGLVSPRVDVCTCPYMFGAIILGLVAGL